MKVQINDVDYKVSWEYGVNTTRCVIEWIKSNNLPTYTSGNATKNSKEQHVKKVARKISLMRALLNIDFTKEERMIFWNTYKNMTKIPRW